MKAKNVIRKFRSWDADADRGRGEEVTQLMTDWDLVMKAPGQMSLLDYTNAALRILLETCDVDPDLYKPLDTNSTQTEALRLSQLIQRAIDNVQGDSTI